MLLSPPLTSPPTFFQYMSLSGPSAHQDEVIDEPLVLPSILHEFWCVFGRHLVHPSKGLPDYLGMFGGVTHQAMLLNAPLSSPFRKNPFLKCVLLWETLTPNLGLSALS